MLYQRKQISDNSNIGEPAPLPPQIATLGDAALVDISSAVCEAQAEAWGLAGQGFFPVSNGPRVISALAFMQRIPEPKREAIMQAAAAPDYKLQVFLEMIQAANNGVDLDDEDTAHGLAYAVIKGLLTIQDVAAILA